MIMPCAALTRRAFLVPLVSPSHAAAACVSFLNMACMLSPPCCVHVLPDCASESGDPAVSPAGPSLGSLRGMNGCQGHSAHPVQWMGTGVGGVTVILTFNLCFFADISVSLLTLVVTACGLALFGVSLFVSWKLCWVPWRERGLFSGSKDNNQEPLNYTDTETNEQENSEGFLDPPSPCPDSSMKISHTSPDIALSTQVGGQEHCAHGVRMKRQVTEPASSTRSVTPPFFLSARRGPPTHSPLLAAMALSRQETCDFPHVHSVSWT